MVQDAGRVYLVNVRFEQVDVDAKLPRLRYYRIERKFPRILLVVLALKSFFTLTTESGERSNDATRR